MNVSVVVPTFGRPELLARCLGALASQSLGPADFEVIVADDGCDRATRALVSRWSGILPCRTTYVPVNGSEHGPATARNVGWRAAHAGLIAFTDDDTVPARDWLRRGVERFAEGTLQAAWGRVRVPLPQRPTDYERDAASLESAGFVTANCFVRRDLLERLGGFDTAFRLAWREDSDLFFRILDCNSAVAEIADAVVVHPVRPAPWGVSIRQQHKVMYDALLYRKHPRHYARAIRPGRPWLYYPIVAALLTAAAAVLLQQRVVAIIAASVWLALTLIFAMRRLRDTSHAAPHVIEMLVTSAVIPPLSLFHRTRGALTYRVLFW
jgi:Glycosyltransferases, probably involved in cell wall biogenesis